MSQGALYLGKERCRFEVWAPFREKVEVKLEVPGEIPQLLSRDGYGLWSATIEGVPPGARYRYLLDGSVARPDPASAFQPLGVHGPSAVVDHGAFAWSDPDWSGIPLEQMVLYELHVGAFTMEGTFDAVIPRLGELLDLGVNTLSLMPVAQFPGARNWGYDGAYPYAVQNSYGGPEGFKRLIDACHGRGLAVILDVVYNHLGPEGNYLADYGPYFTDRYHTPWGSALNFDGPYSDPVRAFFIDNAIHWFADYHLDGLRLDAVHAIYDTGAKHFLEELGERVEAFSLKEGRLHLLIAESDLNDVRLIRPRDIGGYGLDAQWHDDFHHSLHALVTGERNGYYADFGATRHLAKALAEGFVYDWAYSPSRNRHHGSSSRDRHGRQFVVFSQNHDQVGNRPGGERLASLVPFEALKLAAAAVLLSPFVPMLFMGEEYGEENPFHYFVDHSDPTLIEAVRRGRRQEFEGFHWGTEIPDPQSPSTFAESRLEWSKRKSEKHKILLDFHTFLLRLRKNLPVLAEPARDHLQVSDHARPKTVMVQRAKGGEKVLILLNFNSASSTLAGQEIPVGRWCKVADSAERRWLGPGSPLPERLETGSPAIISRLSMALYRMEFQP
ncbi:MAG: malto-oligosyltrehalose trehalohydrolase [Desulfuromonadaceae bacterium]|nr:malto-oligosyltrehalose trehalohydrolase [Desulfuromonadaceae bacterium]